jgi:hypothetical protein
VEKRRMRSLQIIRRQMISLAGMIFHRTARFPEQALIQDRTLIQTTLHFPEGIIIQGTIIFLEAITILDK